MVVLAGMLSVGWGFAFTYSQGPIIQAMKLHGAGDFPAGIAVWAVALLARRSQHPLSGCANDTKQVVGRNRQASGRNRPFDRLRRPLFRAGALLGKGMLLLGPLGASVGWGLVQGTVILGGQLLGFVSGEWQGVTRIPRHRMYLAIALLIVAMTIMACAKAAS